HRNGALKLGRRFGVTSLAGKVDDAPDFDRARSVRRTWFKTLTLVVTYAEPCARDVGDRPQCFHSSHRLNPQFNHLARRPIGFLAHALRLSPGTRGRRKK